MTIFIALIALLLAYLIGSLSSAIILAKILKQPDPRTQGSGNAGATNVLRSTGIKQALLVLAGDLLKGVLAVVTARLIGVQGFFLGLVALSVVVGHIFPIYFEFKGGKGVATAVGSIFALSPWLGLLTALIWIATALISRYASLASMLAVSAAVILSLVLRHADYALPLLLIAVLIIWKHQKNIQRLRNKSEGKIKFKR